MTRLVKQLLYGGVYLVVLAVLVYGAYRVLVPQATCTDGVQNGEEEGVDCGALACGVLCAAPVRELENHAPDIIGNTDGSTDVLGNLENPNVAYGAKRVDYTVKAWGPAGEELYSRRGSSYVNPVQSRYLVIPLGKTSAAVASAALQFGPADVEWATLPVGAAGDVQFAVRGDTLASSSSGTRYSGIVANESRFDFDNVEITVRLLDASGEVVGAGSTRVSTLVAGEGRSFVIDWPFAIPGVKRWETDVSTNLFDNDNFIRTHGSEELLERF